MEPINIKVGIIRARQSCEGCPDQYDCCQSCAEAWREIALKGSSFDELFQSFNEGVE